MRKIPTLFRRDPEDMRYLTREVNPDCQWVIDGEGTPTRKYDGTCMKFDGQRWWARREVKPGKAVPAGFVAEQTDDITGKTVGWEPAAQSPFAKYLAEATHDWIYDLPHMPVRQGTYELCGPKVQGNPEGFGGHVLVHHGSLSGLADVPRDYDGLETFLKDFGHEGVVWHHPDGQRMAKIKVRDFRR